MSVCKKETSKPQGRNLNGNRMVLNGREWAEPEISMRCEHERVRKKTLGGSLVCEEMGGTKEVVLEGVLSGTADEVAEMMEALGAVCGAGSVEIEHELLNRMGVREAEVKSLEFPKGKEEVQNYKMVLVV